MGNGMNRVLNGLYVGNYRDSKDAGQLERHRITHIIAIHDCARRLHTDKEYLCITASDTPSQNLQQFFPACNDFIHEARAEGGNVLIHCLAGMSRSVTIVVAYIMSISSLRWNEALKVVRGARAVSNPNSGFLKQLQEYDNTKLLDERRRLADKFPVTPQFEHDEEHCRRLLISYDHLLLAKAICDGRCTSARICPTGTCRAHASSRFTRQRSGENSPRGSTKSLDSSGNEPPSSPRNWERHYGCWKNHVRNQPGSTSTPASPILYRTSKSQSRRSDSMLSISSVSSITSLPGQISLEKDSPRIRSDRKDALLSTQSCPNSPRRMPRKPGAALLVTQSQLGSLGSGVSPIDVARLLAAKDKRTEDTLAVPLPSSSSGSVTPSCPDPATSTSSLTEVSKNNSVGESSAGSSRTTTSWGTPPPTSSPCHRFIAHNNAHAAGVPAPTTTARNTIHDRARGITRWVMKRSAYKFSFDKSS